MPLVKKATLVERLVKSGVPLASVKVTRKQDGKNGASLSFAITVQTQETPRRVQMKKLFRALNPLRKTEVRKILYDYKEDLFTIHLTSWTDHPAGDT